MVKTSRLKTAELREERVQGFAPLPASGQRVDRQLGVIYGVKVVGNTSPNSHKMPGATAGSKYTLEAFTRALPLYEGLPVNIDHPPHSTPGVVRGSEDRLGKLVNARLLDGEIFADLHVLKSHPMSDRLMEAAERMPDAFALSHNALGYGDVHNGTYLIEEIAQVRSVDVVTEGGTNRSLFESRQTNMPKITVRKLFEAAGPKAKPSAKKQPKLAAFMRSLLEDDSGDYSAVMDSESDSAEAPADHEQALKDGFEASVSAIVKKCLDGEDDPGDCIKKISQLLKAHNKLSGDGEKDMEESDDGPKDEPKDEPKKTEESRKHCARLAKGFLYLQEKQEPAKQLVEALVKLPDDDSRLSLLESWPKGTATAPTGRGGSAPRSSSPVRPIQESAVPNNAEEQAALLLR